MPSRCVAALLLLAGTVAAGDSPPVGDPLPKGAIRRFGSGAFWFEHLGVDVSADGKWLVGLRADGPVVVDVATGRTVWRRGNDDPGFRTARFSGDGRCLLLAAERVLETWDVRTWKRRHQTRLPEEADLEGLWLPAGGAIALGRRMVGLEEGGWQHFLDAYSLETGKRLTEYPLPKDNPARWCATPDGQYFAVLRADPRSEDGPAEAGPLVEVVHRPTARLRAGFRLDPGQVEEGGMALSADGKRLGVCTGSSVQVWDVAGGKPERVWPADGPESRLLFPSDGRTLVVSTFGAIRSYDLSTGKAGPAVRLPGGNMRREARGLREVAGGRVLGWATDWRRVRLWDVGTGKEIGPAGGHPDLVGSLAFTLDGSELRSASSGAPPLRWAVATGQALGPLVRPRSGTPLAEWSGVGGEPRLSPDGRFAVIPFGYLSDSPFLPPGAGTAVWDTEARSYTAHDLSGGAGDLDRAQTFSPDGRLLVVKERKPGDERIDVLRLFDLRAGRPGRALVSRSGCAATAFTPDGGTVAGIEPGARATLAGWDVRSGRRLFRQPIPWPAADDLAFLDHRRAFLAGKSGGAAGCFVLDTVTGKEAPWAEHPVVIPEVFPRLPLSPDRRLLAIPTTTGLAVYEIASGSIRHRFDPPSPVTALAFSPNGRTLASGHLDTSTLLWDLGGASGKTRPTDESTDWGRLAGPDAAAAWNEMRHLIARPAEAVALVRERVRPTSPPDKVDPAQLDRLIASLDATRYAVRQAAAAELVRIGPEALPAVEKAKAAVTSEEVRARLNVIHDRLTGPENLIPWLAELRAVEVLERIATPAAVEHLTALAAGGDSPTTRAAKQAVEHLSAAKRLTR